MMHACVGGQVTDLYSARTSACCSRQVSDCDFDAEVHNSPWGVDPDYASRYLGTGLAKMGCLLGIATGWI